MITPPQLMQKKRSPLWIKCLLLSVTAHAALAAYLYYNPLFLQSPLQSLFEITLADPKSLPDDPAIDFLDKNYLLEEVFKTLIVTPSQLHPPYDLNALPEGIALAPQEEHVKLSYPELEDNSSFTALIDKNLLTQEAILKEAQEVSPSPLFLCLEEEAKAVSHLQIDDPLLSLEIPFIESFSELSYSDIVALHTMPETAVIENESGLFIQQNPLDFKQSSAAKMHKTELEDLLTQEHKPTLLVPKAQAPAQETRVIVQPKQKPFDQHTFTLTPSALWNEDFSVDISIAPQTEGSGYLFALTLTPTKDLSAHRLKQNFYFLLDRSSSSQKRRFPVFKRATLKALASIQAEDTFNIFILDKQITKFSSENKRASLKNKRDAEEFLETQEARSLLSQGNIYTTLQQILPSIPENEEMHTAILLSDGMHGMNTGKKKDAFNRWIRENRGKVTLYTAAVGKDNDLLSLDMLSTESGGKLLYSDTHASFPRKLAKLILDLKHPLASQLDVSVKPHQSRSKIVLYPSAYMLPPLYANEPYVILGETDKLTTFDLIIEGRHKEDWIGIKKKISFDQAHQIEPQVVKLWKKAKASVCYAKFLSEGKDSHLQEAKDILNRSQKEIAFK